MNYFHVTAGPGKRFVGELTLAQIRAQVDSGKLKDSLFATESDGRSFKKFQASGGGRWRTLADLLAEQPTATRAKDSTVKTRAKDPIVNSDVSANEPQNLFAQVVQNQRQQNAILADIQRKVGCLFLYLVVHLVLSVLLFFSIWS